MIKPEVYMALLSILWLLYLSLSIILDYGFSWKPLDHSKANFIRTSMGRGMKVKYEVPFI